MSTQPLVVLDACCVINLCATGCLGEILRGLPFQFAVSAEMADEELLFVTNQAGERDLIDPATLGHSGLASLTLDPSEIELFVDFAAQLGDGEARTCALAVSRGAHIATDDRKTIRILMEDFPEVTIHTTPSLLKHWSDASAVSPALLSNIIQRIEIGARYRPGSREPLLNWWTQSREC